MNNLVLHAVQVEGLPEAQRVYLNLLCRGMEYDQDFILSMAREIKTMNAAELAHATKVTREAV